MLAATIIVLFVLAMLTMCGWLASLGRFLIAFTVGCFMVLVLAAIFNGEIN